MPSSACGRHVPLRNHTGQQLASNVGVFGNMSMSAPSIRYSVYTLSFGAALLQGKELPGPILTIGDAFAADSLHEEPGGHLPSSITAHNTWHILTHILPIRCCPCVVAVSTSERATSAGDHTVSAQLRQRPPLGCHRPNKAAVPTLVLLVAAWHCNRSDACPTNLHNAAAPSADEAAKGAEKRAAVDAALAAAPRSIRGARYAIGSQQHFYMEPQARGTIAGLFCLQCLHREMCVWASDSASHAA